MNRYSRLLELDDITPEKLNLLKRKKVLIIGVDGYKGQCCLFLNKSLKNIVNSDILSSPKDGVLGPMVGLVSSYASLMTIKYLLEEKVETDSLHYYDYLTNRLVKMSI